MSRLAALTFVLILSLVAQGAAVEPSPEPGPAPLPAAPPPPPPPGPQTLASHFRGPGVNWFGFSRYGYALGLDSHPYQQMVGRIAELGYGSVRLSWAENVLIDWDKPIDAGRFREFNSTMTVGQLFVGTLEELARRDIDVLLDYHPQKQSLDGDDQDFRNHDVPMAWDGMLAALGQGLSANARAHIKGADVYNEPNMRGDQIPYRDMVVRTLGTILSYRKAFPNMLGVVEPCDGGAGSWIGNNPWWLLHDLKNAGFGPDRVMVEIHFYPYWTTSADDPWQAANVQTGVQLGQLPYDQESAVLQHNVQQAEDWRYTAILGEYGFQDDAWGDTIAQIAAGRDIPRFRWVLIDTDEKDFYGVVNDDPELSQKGRKSALDETPPPAADDAPPRLKAGGLRTY